MSVVCLTAEANSVYADDGHGLWLRCNLVWNEQKLTEYRQSIKTMMIECGSATIQAARNEMETGLAGLLGPAISEVKNVTNDGVILIGNFRNLHSLREIDLKNELEKAGVEGFVNQKAELDGVKGIEEIQKKWDSLKGKIDAEKFNSVRMLLEIQHNDAITWRDGCVLSFQTFSHLPIPPGLPAPEHDLEYYEEHNPR
jgi:alpha-glucuronidase